MTPGFIEELHEEGVREEEYEEMGEMYNSYGEL